MKIKMNALTRPRRTYQALVGLVADARAAAMLPRLQGDCVPWSGTSLRPGAIQQILTEVLIHDKQQIVELGSGVSTLYLAEVARQCGARVWSIEHDERWLETMNRLLNQHALYDRVELIHAPLQECLSPWGPVQWYSVRAVHEGLNGAGLDLLLVDGPPAGRKASPFARYPAIPELRDQFDRFTSIFVDDIDRAGESRICRTWEHELDVRFKFRLTQRIAWARFGH